MPPGSHRGRVWETLNPFAFIRGFIVVVLVAAVSVFALTGVLFSPLWTPCDFYPHTHRLSFPVVCVSSVVLLWFPVVSCFLQKHKYRSDVSVLVPLDLMSYRRVHVDKLETNDPLWGSKRHQVTLWCEDVRPFIQYV